MANIMLTERCNLRCSYCFANEYVNHAPREISLEHFNKAVDFICAGGDYSLGLIGGEPTLHSHFQQILSNVMSDARLRRISIFTNGILLDRFAAQLSDEKFSILVNCNSPHIIGERLYHRILSNIKLLIEQYNMKDRITLGVNIYNPSFKYGYLLDALQQFEFRTVRMSLTVPNTAAGQAVDHNMFFSEMKPILIQFVSDMLQAGIIPHYDCNKMPVCFFTEEEKRDGIRLIAPLQAEYERARGHSQECSLLSEYARCSPVVDILPDLSAVRCFGLSSFTRKNILDFRSIHELRSYYINEIDSYAYKIYGSAKCKDCSLRQTQKCSAGCLAYHIRDLSFLRSRVEDAAGALLQERVGDDR